jgi:hypothetical protein
MDKLRAGTEADVGNPKRAAFTVTHHVVHLLRCR